MNTVAARKTSYTHSDNHSDISTDSGDIYDIIRDDKHHPKKSSFVLNSKAKSSLCRNFMDKGECPYG